MTAREFFYGAGGRLRAPWRVMGFVLIAALVFAIAGPVFAWLRPRTTLQALWVFSSAAVLSLAAAHFVMVRVIDDLPWRMVWLDRGALSMRTLGWAFGLGAGAVAIPALGLLSAGWLDAERTAGGWGDALRYGLATGAVLVPAAMWEELLFRGYILRVLKDALGAWPAVLLTSAAFGVAHAGNLATVQPLALGLVMLAGVLLGWVVLARRSLYAAIVTHIAWNAVLVVGLHTEVSGAQLGAAPAYRVVDDGPDWATGGAWGPEGGLAAGAGLTVALLITLSRRPIREER